MSTTTPTVPERPGQPPFRELRSGGIRAAIWRKEVEDSDGRKYFQYSVKITRSYKDKGVWQETDNFFRDHLPRLMLVAMKAYESIVLNDYDSGEPEPPI